MGHGNAMRRIFSFIHNRWLKKTRFKWAHIHHSVQCRGNFAMQLGQGVSIGSGTVICGDENASIDIGPYAWIGNDCELSTIGSIKIGAHTSLQHRTQLHGEVAVGAGCIGAAGLYISSGWHEFRRQPSVPIRLQDRAKARLPVAQRSRPVVVEEDCWLGINVAVMPGVTIGRGCIVGANSVVTRDLPPYSIAAGAPARIVGQRLDFQPPMAIDASSDDHLPYFYAGFQQIHADDTLTGPPRTRGGLLVGKGLFAIALRIETEQTVELTFDSLVSGSLVHGGCTQCVRLGRNTLCFPALPSTNACLFFNWKPDTSLPSQDELAVLSAKVTNTKVFE